MWRNVTHACQYVVLPLYFTRLEFGFVPTCNTTKNNDNSNLNSNRRRRNVMRQTRNIKLKIQRIIKLMKGTKEYDEQIEKETNKKRKVTHEEEDNKSDSYNYMSH
jgi:hypothetical protein